MMKKLFFFVFLISLMGSQTFGLIQFKDGETHNVENAINDDLWVDWELSGIQTTVNILPEGAIPAPYKLKGYNTSILNISGGSVYGLSAYGNTVVNISDGSLDSSLYAYDNSIVTISGGSTNSSNAYGNSQITMTEGYANYLSAYENGRIIVSGGYVNTNLSASDNGKTEISGGSVRSALQAVGSGQVEMSGGDVGFLYATNNGQITLSEGSVDGNLNAYDSTLITMSGGSIGGDLRLTTNAELIIYGTDFAIDGVPVTSNIITSLFGGSYLDEPHRRLTGILANGGMLDNPFIIGNSALITLQIVEVEPVILNVQSLPIDSNTITPCIGQHNYGMFQVVNIKAERFINCPSVYEFDHWLGDVADPNSANTTVYMDSDKTVTAIYVDARQCGDECHPYPSGDLSRDCSVDLYDIAIIAQSWLECTKPECD